MHIRETTPIARTDNFIAAQWKKLRYILQLATDLQCPVYCTGDFFDNWKPSPELLSTTIRVFKDYPDVEFYTIFGNHDLPQHNIENAQKSGLNTLMEAGVVLYHRAGTNWGQYPTESSHIRGRAIMTWHVMTYRAGKLPYPGCTDISAEGLLRKYPQYDAIFTGHNHKQFIVKYNSRLLINPGSMTRQAVDQTHMLPSVWLYNADSNNVEQHILPHEKDVISDEHITKVEQRDSRIDAFISLLNTDVDSLSLEDNLQKIIRQNKISKQVETIIYGAIENVG